MTSTPTRERSRHPYPPLLRTLRVAEVEELSPTMRRFVLTGPQLEPEFPFVALATAMHVKVVLPQADTGRVVLPTLSGRGLSAPDGLELVVRDYTVRRVEPATRSLTLDFVLHEHGPAGRWALDAAPGAEVGVLGPRGYTTYPSGFVRYVLGADETGLPALERWIEEAPPGVRLEAVVAASRQARRPLPSAPGLSVSWLDATGTNELTEALVAAASLGHEQTFVWAAAEYGMVGPLRRHLQAAGFSRTSFDVSGYWRSGVAGSTGGPENHS